MDETQAIDAYIMELSCALRAALLEKLNNPQFPDGVRSAFSTLFAQWLRNNEHKMFHDMEKKKRNPQNFDEKTIVRKKQVFFRVFFMISLKSCQSKIALGIFFDFLGKVLKKTCRFTVERLWKK